MSFINEIYCLRCYCEISITGCSYCDVCKRKLTSDKFSKPDYVPIPNFPKILNVTPELITYRKHGFIFI